MNASMFMDKQIMDLSRSKSSNDFIDLMDPKEENEADRGVKKEEILPSYDFQTIRPIGVSSYSTDAAANSSDSSINAARAWNSADSRANTSAVRSYGYLDLAEGDKVILEKAQGVNDLAIVSEIDRTMKKHTDNLLHSIDGLSARLSQLESRIRHLENSVDDLKASTASSHGGNDEKMRQLENILREVHAGVQNVKDKQEVMEAQMHLANLQISKGDQTPESGSHTRINPVQQAASAPHPSSQQFPVPVQQPLPILPPNAPPPQQNIQPPTPVPSQFPQSQIPSVPQRDAYFPPPGQTQEAPSLPFQMPPAQQQQPHPPQQHQHFQQPPPSLPYPQPPQPPQLHSSVATVNHPSLHQPPPLGNLPEETPYLPSQQYQANLHQPSSQPAGGPPKQFYGSPSHIYEPSPGRSSSGFSSGYVQSSGPSEPYAYSGSPLRYGSGSSIKPPQTQPSSGGSGYPQLPTARILPQAIPTASAVSGGSGAGGTGNRVPIDDVIDKVTNMGFPREHVRATVRKLTENGQAVDLNVVLDKLMNDGELQPQRGWFGR
ncbi:hypothetical protein Ancab_025721 [Ancistrocladus abbreviatus]